MKNYLFALALIVASFVFHEAHAATSPNDTAVIAPSTATITDSAGTVWALAPTAPCTATWAVAGTVGEVSRSGALDATTCQVKELAFVNGVIWQLSAAGNWYPMTSSGGWGTSQTASPLPAIVAVSYSETLSWSPVTTNIDGSVPVSITYNVYEASATGVLTSYATGLTATTATYLLGSAGASVCFAISATNDQGIESARTATACKSFAAVAPNAPTGLTVK